VEVAQWKLDNKEVAL